MSENIEHLVREAAQAHTSLSLFYQMIEIAGGPEIRSGTPEAVKIVALCKAGSARSLRDYDRAVAKIKRAQTQRTG